jgi:hypothetical protein
VVMPAETTLSCDYCNHLAFVHTAKAGCEMLLCPCIFTPIEIVERHRKVFKKGARGVW